jgi:hypothetical protein
VTAAAISAFRTQSVRAANSAHGVEVGFRGQTLRVVLAPIAISLDLATGGLTQGGQFRCHFLAADLATPPQRGESLTYRGRSYTIRDIADSTSEAEHIVTIAPGGKL